MKQLMKKQKHLAEDCMKTIEKLDSVANGIDVSNNLKFKRKSLIKIIQVLFQVFTFNPFTSNPIFSGYLDEERRFTRKDYQFSK